MDKVALNFKSLVTDGAIAAAVGTAAATAGTIDLRPKVKVDHLKYLGNNYKQVKKHLKPGDVLVGAPMFADESVAQASQDFGKTYPKVKKDYEENFLKGKKTTQLKPEDYKKLEKSTPGFAKAFVPSIATLKKTVGGELPSKLPDTNWSHSEMVMGDNKTAWSGTGFKTIDDRALPKDKADAARKLKDGRTAHYIVMRPKDDGSNLFLKSYKEDGAKAALAKIKKSTGTPKDYNVGGAVAGYFKDLLIPKLRTSERTKTPKEIKKDLKQIGGICSALGAQYSAKTVGGKSLNDVLPKDYLRSSEWDAVGRIGPERKNSAIGDAGFGALGLATRIGVGVGAAGLTLGGIKATKMIAKSTNNFKGLTEFAKMLRR